MKNYIDLIFFESYIEFIFFIISRIEGKCDRRIISILSNRISFAIKELYRSYFMIFRELYRIEFLFLSTRGWKVNAIEELYRIEFFFIICDGLILFLLINFEV